MKWVKNTALALTIGLVVTFLCLCVYDYVPRRGTCPELNNLPFVEDRFPNVVVHDLAYHGYPSFLAARGVTSEESMRTISKSLDLNVGVYRPDFAWLKAHDVPQGFVPPNQELLMACGRFRRTGRSYISVYFVPRLPGEQKGEGTIYLLIDT